MNCTIREWRITDAEELCAAINNKNIQNNLRDGIPYPYTIKDAEMYINNTINSKNNSAYCWAVAVNDKAIGSIGIFRKDNIHFRTAEIGYYIAETYWGKGIGTNAVKEACAYVFENTDILRIFAEPFAGNIASCRLLEKAGFSYEGTLRKNAEKNGRVIDMKMYALVKD